jgi:hypothetical protein
MEGMSESIIHTEHLCRDHRRQASQTMLLGLILFGLVIATVVRLLPPELIASLTTPQMVLIILLVMVVLDAILLVASLFSFQRSRLLLR